jgi:L-iditol 2-dehydrogenase
LLSTAAKGQENLCEDLLFNNGAYAEYIRIPGAHRPAQHLRDPPHLTYQDAALSEPLACVLKGLEDTNVRAGDNVVVIGQGPIGLMFVRLAKVYGARVIALGRRTSQLDRALRWAPTMPSSTRAATMSSARSATLTGGYGADIVIEAVGQPETWELSVKLVRRGGT